MEDRSQGSLGSFDVVCPLCGYSLNATIDAGLRACPECGWRFTDQDVRLLGPSDPAGQPRTLNPQESRVGGPLLMLVLTLVSAALVGIAVWVSIQIRR